MIMEAEKAHGRPSASWRPWDADGTTPSKAKGLRTRETDGVTLSPKASESGGPLVFKYWSPKAREPGVSSKYRRGRKYPSPSRQRDTCAFSLFLLSLGPQQVEWSLPTLRAGLPYLIHPDSRVNLLCKPPHRHTQNNAFPGS